MNKTNPWDNLSKTFKSENEINKISPSAADNILIAWPVILRLIEEYFPDSSTIKALDYGCGGGGFTNKLQNMGYEALGIDSSNEMIKSAIKTYPNLKFLCGDINDIKYIGGFNIITSIMTFQFIRNVDIVITNLFRLLKEGGLFVFAVHNPSHVRDCLKSGVIFEDFDSIENPKNGKIKLGGNLIPIYIRTKDIYNQLFVKLGMKLVLESYPPFTEEFLIKFPVNRPINESEYLILGYRK